mgnify:CR=1 FL=1
MKDRYLFRGKCIDDGEWMYGSYYELAGRPLIFKPVFASKKTVYEIDPSTVCQCTGRNDKNGKLIYENDIMVAYYGEENPEHGTYVMVTWREYGWVTVENNSDDPCPLDDFTIKHFEVVGNMIDNPELLEV